MDSSADLQEWLDRYTDEQAIRDAYIRAQAWMSTIEKVSHPDIRQSAAKRWGRRIKALKAKALVMGINVEG